MLVARPSGANDMLDNSRICHGERVDLETQRNAVYRRELDLRFAVAWGNEAIEYGDEEGDGSGSRFCMRSLGMPWPRIWLAGGDLVDLVLRDIGLRWENAGRGYTSSEEIR